MAQENECRRIIIDTDPGHDDALAILLAARHFDVLGITTVFGNQSVDRTTENALKILEFSGLSDIPVFKGSQRPMLQGIRLGSAAHGATGLDGPDLPAPRMRERKRHAVDFIIDTVMAVDDVTLVPIGPMTNVGLALQREPRLASRVREISLMGGSTTFGNSTPAAELNVYCDPEAAHIVFNSGIPIKMVGLNLTRQTVADEGIVRRFRSMGTKTGGIVAEIIEWYSLQGRRLFGLRGASMHDPCAVAWLIDPSLIESRMIHVDIELRGQLTRGMTVCDLRHLGQPGAPIAGHDAIESSRRPNVDVGMGIDCDRFFDLLVGAISEFG